MKAISIFALVLLSACSSSSSHSGKGDGGKQGSGGVTGTGGAGGSKTPDGSSSVTCATASLNTAPDACPANWITALVGYPASCPVVPGGYQARCEPYDTVIYEKGTRQDFCFYDDPTGNLIGAKSITHGAVTCESFDFSFTAPDVASCMPMGTAKCNDAGP